MRAASDRADTLCVLCEWAMCGHLYITTFSCANQLNSCCNEVLWPGIYKLNNCRQNLEKTFDFRSINTCRLVIDCDEINWTRAAIYKDPLQWESSISFHFIGSFICGRLTRKMFCGITDWVNVTCIQVHMYSASGYHDSKLLAVWYLILEAE